MSRRYLLHFVQDHLTFRWNEFLALTSKHRCIFNLITKENLLTIKPYVIVEVNSQDDAQSLIKTVQDSYLLRGLYELWAHSSSIEGVVQEVLECCYFKSGVYLDEQQSFKINVESYGKKLSQETKVSLIERLHFLNLFKSNPDMKNPRQIYHLFNYCPGFFDSLSMRLMKADPEYYFCRQVCASSKSVISKFDLKIRKFIANTTMDPLLSFVATNLAKVEANQLVYDPFVGSGGLLIPAAYMGAYVVGTDIDFLLLHGRSKPSRHNQKTREAGESVKANLQQYSLEARYIDVIVSDISKSPLHSNFRVNSIITDPPYGVRESSEKVGTKKQGISSKGYKTRYPAKTNYMLHDLVRDLLLLAAKHLLVGGRLVYFLPITVPTEDINKCMPSHPCLKFLYYCEQGLTPKISRLLIVMEKTRESTEGEDVTIPQALVQMNFRETYFGTGC